jgi:DNA-binding PadR family transcriptional regulator
MSLDRELLMLGILSDAGALSAYDLSRAVQAHGVLYPSLLKANVYPLLTRLAEAGYLRVRGTPAKRGPRAEKAVYSLTVAGKERFAQALTDAVVHVDPLAPRLEVGVILLSTVPSKRALALLAERRRELERTRARVRKRYDGFRSSRIYPALAAKHMLTMIDADISWVDDAVRSIHRAGRHEESKQVGTRGDDVDGG